MRICFFGTYDPNYTSNKLILNGLSRNNIEVIEVNVPIAVTKLDSQEEMSWSNLLKRILRKYKMLGKIWSQRKDLQRSDVIYVGYPGHFDVFIAFIAAKIFHKKLIFNPLLVIYTGFSEEQGLLKKSSLMGILIKFFEGTAYKLCDLIFADTPFQKKYLENIFGVPEEKIKILSIGADDEFYKYHPLNNESKSIKVVYYGLYSPIHGVEHIIEAARLSQKNKNIKFIMVGQGNTFSKNYERAKSLELKNIEFYHHIDQSLHPKIIQQADVFLGFLQKHPSVERIIPNKIYQGLSLGKVVLTADAPVIRSVFEPGKNIYVCQAGNPQSLYEALSYLSQNSQARKEIAQNGYQLFKKNFTPAAVGKQLGKYVSEIM
ncbi:glycosyltransferase family 4 protein [Candidatus Microgenomates bacterium]|nr:glycosyltransferase family 4 protein [Candidatus Microgenomates bacterium]